MTATSVRYETVIGLEVHVQLQTNSKMFCGCPADYSGAEPNTHTCPICMGMPGVLPVVNEKAVEYTIMTGLALNCSIPEFSKFDRKNYPYPDLMKGYQISQYDLPFCVNGWLDIGTDDEEHDVGVTRVHLEEDTATSRHLDGGDGEGFTLIDVNRAGSPLMEIVGEPDLRSPEEAREYLMRLQRILRYIGVSQANMEEGNFRCDANVSLRRFGDTELGAKVEVKNMNSFRSVYHAIAFEMERQAGMLDRGERIEQETRGWVDNDNKTVSQRSKEQAHDYRYFPEPDLPPATVSAARVAEIREKLPELPGARRRRFEQEFELPAHDADQLTESRARADYFEAAARAPASDTGRIARARAVSNWMLGDMARLMNAGAIPLSGVKIVPEQIGELVSLVDAGTITSAAAKQVFQTMFESGRAPAAIVAESGLTQISDTAIIEETAKRVLDANPRPVADYRGGKHESINVLFGQVMRETNKRANAAVVREVLERLLSA